MPNAWVPGFALTLLFGLLCSFQPVSANEVSKTSEPFGGPYGAEACLRASPRLTLNCTKGFSCCHSGCCLEKNIWDSSNDPLRILFILCMVMIPLLCICGFMRRFCRKCREPGQNLRTNHQIPPEPPSLAPLETIWVTTLDPPPPYSQIGEGSQSTLSFLTQTQSKPSYSEVNSHRTTSSLQPQA
ncbi:hypothetical protein A6R68_16123 [Neotoma lepida]|uniref:Transmembrane protein 92 n=1 Tax=Neotoma lepida TaxID=56216 RepID=A0A1A6HHH7_NEOLE|nr:hypothetical protein A6R68_16123 [Neotoma lepida]